MILCSGVFDGIHAGHVAYLRAAAKCRLDGEPLIVAVAPDAYVRTVKQRDPHWRVADRLYAVEALGMVHWVLVHGETGVEDVITRHRPRLFVKAEDWKDRLTDAVRKACYDAHTSILFVPERPTKHTSDVA